MKRRALLRLLLGGAATALPVAARAQQQRRIGFLSSVSADGQKPFIGAFRRGLNETGYDEGRNLLIEYRWADGDFARLPGLAADLARANVEVIVTAGGPQPAGAVMQATAAIPIVGSSVGSLVKHFNRPEGNLTGVSIVTTDLNPKRLQILAELVPGAAIGVLIRPANSAFERDRKELQSAGRTLGVDLHFANAAADRDLEPAFANLAGLRVGALLIAADPFFNSRREQLVALAARHAIPAMHEWRESVAAGGLISYGPPLAEIYHQVGVYTGRILNGDKPGDLPVVEPSRLELVINLKTAQALGLTVPHAMLLRADEVIE
jgi:putative tryptophan/tyrosine transport system substrate-binding protein